MLSIIVAYYNNKSYENLLIDFEKEKEDELLDDIFYIIYNKSSNIIDLKIPNLIILDVNNIGREGETYLNHIINYYEKLDDFTLFIQDDVNNHIVNNKEFILITNEIMKQNIDFYQYPVTWKEGDKTIHRRQVIQGYCNLHTLGDPFAIKNACTRLGLQLPEVYITFTCAFFILNKRRIYRHNKLFYIKCREWLLEDEKNGFILELLWYIIFGDL